jgi:protein phosphatase
MNYQLESACVSHIGTIRENNEDNVFFNGLLLNKDNTGTNYAWTGDANSKKASVYAVFDGMGGESKGELASFIAADQLADSLDNNSSSEGTKEFLYEYIQKANERICSFMSQENIARMGTTAALVHIKNDEATILNVGDSRVYMLTEDGVRLMTVDHTDEALMQESGIKRPPRLTQHLGIYPEEMILEPHIITEQIYDGNRFMICSDGLYGWLPKDTIQSLMRFGGTPSETVGRLVSEALKNGSSDNATAIVIDINGK